MNNNYNGPLIIMCSGMYVNPGVCIKSSYIYDDSIVVDYTNAAPMNTSIKLINKAISSGMLEFNGVHITKELLDKVRKYAGNPDGIPREVLFNCGAVDLAAVAALNLSEFIRGGVSYEYRYIHYRHTPNSARVLFRDMEHNLVVYPRSRTLKQIIECRQ